MTNSATQALLAPELTVDPTDGALLNHLSTLRNHPECTATIDRDGSRVIIACCPHIARDVLVRRADKFPKVSEGQRWTKMLFGDGMLTSRGHKWEVQHRLHAKVFSHDSVDRYIAPIVSAADELTHRWAASTNDVEPYRELRAHLIRLVGEIFLGCHVAEPGVVADAIETTVAADIGRADHSAAAQAHAQIRRTAAQIHQHHSRGSSQASARHGSGGLLRTLLQAESNAEITSAGVEDAIVSILASGHETTSSALSWLLLILSEFPVWQERIAAEGPIHPDATASEISVTHPNTVAVMHEVIRLYPPAYVIGRDTSGGVVLDGSPLPDGTRVLVSPWLSNRDERLWELPDHFLPERWFTDSHVSAARGAYYPFGLGARGCIGTRLATTEIVITLASIVSTFRVSRSATTTGVRADPFVTLRPAAGEAISLSRR
ncbi:MAG: cytochrome P450 [Mycobacterium sp.]|nr:cytochrome P450 [Mycobacterium sp.]